MQELCEFVGLRVASGAAQLGRFHLWDYWRGRRRYAVPPEACIRDLKAWSNQRVEGVGGPGQEIDLPSAYPSHYRRHPVGTAVGTYGEEPAWAATWYALCLVNVPQELPLAPFRALPDGTERRASWPRSPGLYRSYLWMEQAFACREAGCDVAPIHGWAWESMAEDNAGWIDACLALRERAKTGPRPALEGQVKLMTLAAIGYQGMGQYYYRRVPAGRGERPGLVGGRIADFDEVKTRGHGTMVHWQRYTEMLVSLRMYLDALPYARAGRLLRIETDKLVIAA